MNIPIVILETSSIHFSFVEWGRQPLFHNYAKIHNYVSLNLGTDYANLLSKPKILSKEPRDYRILWETSNIGENPKPYTQLEKDERQKYKQILDQKFAGYNDFLAQLKLKPESEKWAQLIANALIYPTEDFIFCGNDNVVIGGWSLKAVKTSIIAPMEKEPGLFDKLEQKESNSITNSETFNILDQTDEKNSVDSNQINANDGSSKDIDKSDDTQQSYNDDQSQAQLNTDENKIEIEKSDNTPVDARNPTAKTTSDKNIFDQGDGSQDSNEIQNTQTDKDTSSHKKHEPNNEDNRNRPSFFKSVLSGFNWFRILLFLLFLLLLVMFFRTCVSSESVTNFPNEPGIIIPIEIDDIIYDQDSIRQIVKDRLNIVLKGEKRDIKEFSDAFKEIYSSDEYSILYYDTITTRIQIKVPSNMLDSVKNELPTKLPEYDMIIWHESIFRTNVIPSDPAFSVPTSKWHYEAIKAYGAWNETTGNDSIVIAIIDGGFDLNHPEIKGNFINPYNVVNRSNNVFTNPKNTHGSHVAGLSIGAMNNNAGACGVAPKCRYIPIQVSQSNDIITTSAVIDAVLYAIRQGADVINLSLGQATNPTVAFFPPYVQLDIIQNSFKEEEVLWDQIFAMAEENGTTIVMAAGNQNLMVGFDPMQRNPLGIKVNATDQRNIKAIFSNYGPYSTISAPGVGIFSSIPGNKYENMDGTSMSSPIVAGAVGLMKSMRPDISSKEIIHIIQSTGIHVNAGEKVMGNLIQLDKVMDVITGKTKMPDEDKENCSIINEEIERLEREIKRLKDLCPEYGAIQDSMKMPKQINDLSFMKGRWKSTTDIVNNINEKVVIYFDFDGSNMGVITLVEPNNTQCTAKLDISSQSNIVTLFQNDLAKCNPPPKEYQPYVFDCKADQNGTAVCIAQNRLVKPNRYEFNLIKIR